jgi:formylglycine-generating enzyme required for sulfatase activity
LFYFPNTTRFSGGNERMFQSRALYCTLLTYLFIILATPLLAQGDKKLTLDNDKRLTLGDGKRVALVIGNAKYIRNSLKNPKNDAELMAKTLEKEFGFQVTLVLDGEFEKMSDTIVAFQKSLKGASAGLFYYAGHGIQSEGKNYLIPTDFDSQSEEDLPNFAINAQSVLNKMADANCKVNIVILDACRDNPLITKTTKDLTSGLKEMGQIQDMIIAFSTEEGKTASDNPKGDNSIYTEELIKQMRVPGQPIEFVFKETSKSVQEKTGQRPWYSARMSSEFVFLKGDRPTTATVPTLKPKPPVVEDGNPALLLLESNPPGARIIVEGKDTGKKTPSSLVFEFEEPSKEYKVMLLAKGYMAKRLKVTLEPNKKVESGMIALIEAPPGYEPPVIAPANPVLAPNAPKTSKGNGQPKPNTNATQVNTKPTQTPVVVKPQPKPEPPLVTPTTPKKTPPADPGVIAKLEKVIIPAGAFTMGSREGDSTEAPEHEVEVSEFSISKTPVTVGMYRKFAKATKREMPKAPDFNPNWKKENHPMVNITYADALAYCQWVQGDLPTEAEWEKAARGTTKRKFVWGDTFDESKLWYNVSEAQGTVPVGVYVDNTFGLSDMAGNVVQWCKDWYQPDFYGQAQATNANPQGPANGLEGARVIRGSGWNLTTEKFARCTVRNGLNPDESYSFVGFRVVWRTPAQ